MPFITVAQDVNLYYEIIPSISTTTSNSNSIPWLIILPPIFLDITFTFPYIHGPGQLSQNFNIILIDFRCHGRTCSKVSPSCDLWTLAADLAFALHQLKLNQLHVLAGDSLGTEVTLRLIGLFPSLVISACLCCLPPLTEEGFIKTAFQTVMTSWTNPEVPEDWEASVSATQWWLYGPSSSKCSLDVLDAWAGVMVRRYPPSKATHSLGSCSFYVERDPPPPALALAVNIPILVLHGDAENIYDELGAEQRYNEFVNCSNKSSFRVLKNTPLQMFDSFPQRVQEQYYPWLNDLIQNPQLNPSYTNSSHSPIDLVKGLQRLAQILGDPSVECRDPSTSDSFYALSHEKIKSNAERLGWIEKNQINKFSMIGGGAPETWTGASFEEQNPIRFSKRLQRHSDGVEAANRVEEIILAISESTVEDDIQ
ncbi:hypothetical protein O181_062561 [Austropuccinia psidii MF-1]|uniref:AB hydrolase-1 domain-containing protein n=1 Tax=Austropuccinia psidii MF-1 TaxID=1389203 RepID=A0A9Q3EQ02_9BASI|nr:hypothetical protein [Austropuccinia psidii MF-1]